MPEPVLHVRDLTPPLLVVVCDSGQHLNHPGQTCEEFTQLQEQFVAFVKQGLLHGLAEAERGLLEGASTGAPIGFLAMPDVSEPSPAERALAILEPHLADVPLYRPVAPWAVRHDTNAEAARVAKVPRVPCRKPHGQG